MIWHISTSTVQLLWILPMQNSVRHVTVWTIAVQVTEPMEIWAAMIMAAVMVVRPLFVLTAVARCVVVISYLALVADNERL